MSPGCSRFGKMAKVLSIVNFLLTMSTMLRRSTFQEIITATAFIASRIFGLCTLDHVTAAEAKWSGDGTCRVLVTIDAAILRLHQPQQARADKIRRARATVRFTVHVLGLDIRAHRLEPRWR